jgi:hypothetical protein
MLATPTRKFQVKKIKEQEFLDMINGDPAFFEHWNTPLEIIEFVNCQNTEITHLSPYLTFSGKSKVGETADFSNCKSLKIATGTFHGFVWFTNSGIEKIEDLHITECSTDNWAASFLACKSLKIASGTYPGYVNFAESGIHSIQNLHVQKGEETGVYTNMRNCPNLQTLENWDLSKKIWIEAEKLEAEIKRRNSLQNFIKENQAKELPFL